MLELAWWILVTAVAIRWYTKGQYYDSYTNHEDVYTGFLLGYLIADRGPSDVLDSSGTGWDSGGEQPIDGDPVWAFGSVWGDTNETLSGNLSDPDSPTATYPAFGRADRSWSDWGIRNRD